MNIFCGFQTSNQWPAKDWYFPTLRCMSPRPASSLSPFVLHRQEELDWDMVNSFVASLDGLTLGIALHFSQEGLFVVQSFSQIAIMSDDEAPELATMLERCEMLRKRFRKQFSWLQWPIAAIDVEEGEVERHPICTKSLELNVDSVREMVNFYHGAFVDIHQLSAQAPVIFFVLLPMGCT